MTNTTGRRQNEAGPPAKRRYAFPWETEGKAPGEGQYCEKCAYVPSGADGSLCLRCGRYTDNKVAEIVIVAALTLLAAVFSNYVLTGRLLRGTDTLWVTSGLQFPYPIYDSPGYKHTVIFALAALVVLPVITAFHYGAKGGGALACAAGFLSGVPYAGFMLPVVAFVSSRRGSKRWPAELWAITGALLGVVYYFALAYKWGATAVRWGATPVLYPLYREALYGVILVAGELAVLVVLVEILATSWMGYRSWPIIPVTVFAAVGPAVLFFAGVGRPAFEARLLLSIYDPAKTLTAEFPEGYVAGLAKLNRADLKPGRQTGHVIETATYVDFMRGIAVRAADDYLKRFPKSRQAPEVMLFKASMYNALLDFGTLKKLGRLETYFDRISAEAAPVYHEVIAAFPNAAQTALARYYLAKETFQKGKPLEAQTQLEDAEAALATFVPKDFNAGDPPTPANAGELYTNGNAGRRQVTRSVFEALLEVRKLRRLIADGMDYAGQPLQRLAMLDPKTDGFDQKARDIIAHYPNSRVVDNVELLLAQKIWGPAERAAAMEVLLDRYPDSDVRDEMLYEYARALYLANLTGRGAQEAQPLLQKLLAEYPWSTHRAQAVSLLGKVNVAIAMQGLEGTGTRDNAGTSEGR